MLEHGGRLRVAAQQWGIPLADWLDLSTGIAPWTYPVNIPPLAWQRLPEDEDGLVAAAASYYRHPAPLPLPGSQAAIDWLPRLIAPGRAVLPAPTYGEYASAWRAAGHHVDEIADFAGDRLEAAVANADIVMLANPNNPTGHGFAHDHLLAIATALDRRGGWLIVDEAFADAEPERALAGLAGTALAKLVVLRSLGKFFGLAGARVGFLCAAPGLSQQLAAALGPWAVAHPSRVAALQALVDDDWHAGQRDRLVTACDRLGDLLQRHGLASTSGGRLFRYAATPSASALHEHLARNGILVRRFHQPSALRFGLPGSAADWQRLDNALATWSPP